MARVETVEDTPYSEGSILVLGGSSGIGLKAVAEFRRLGAENIYLGTSKPENFGQALRLLERREKVDVSSGIYPFPADVMDRTQIAQAAGVIKAKGPKLKYVVYSQAGGMEGFTTRLFSDHLDAISYYTFDTPIDELEAGDQSVVREKVEDMRRDLAIWTEEALPLAIAVNYQGTLNATEVFCEMFPDGFTGVFYNSTWGKLSGTPGVEIPLIYRPIDLSKAKARDWLQQEGMQLHNSGFHMSELVASLVSDTKVGKMFNDFLLNLMKEEQRVAVKSSSIYSRDVVAATRTILESNPSEWPNYPRVLYVYRQDGKVVTSDSLGLSAMYTMPYPF